MFFILFPIKIYIYLHIQNKQTFMGEKSVITMCEVHAGTRTHTQYNVTACFMNRVHTHANYVRELSYIKGSHLG